MASMWMGMNGKMLSTICTHGHKMEKRSQVAFHDHTTKGLLCGFMMSPHFTPMTDGKNIGSTI